MKLERPKAGLLLLTAEWFAQVGANQGSFRELPQLLQQDAARIAATLGAELEVVNSGICATRQQVAEAVDQFNRAGVDVVIVCQLTWCEDRLMIEAVQRLPTIPLLLWCYTPTGRLPDPLTMTGLFRYSGPVAVLQASAPLKRLDRSFGFAFGSDENPQTVRRIVGFARAARVAGKLRQVTIGVLPYRCDQMTGTYVDEFRLKKEIGPELKYISTHDYRAVCEAVPAERVAAFVRGLRATHPVAPNVTAAGLERAGRVSLGLADVAEKYRLDAIAIEDVGEELHRVLGLRPCLYVPELFERAVVSMEAEVGGATALLMLKMLTGKPPMYTEIFSYDEGENCILIGHAGIHDIRLAESPVDVLIEPDGEYVEAEPDSAWMSFRARAGRVTLLSLFCDTPRFKMVISTGDALGGGRRLLGSPHAWVKMAVPLPTFFEKAVRTGMTQHWALVHDDVVDDLISLASILGLDYVVI